MAIEKEYIVRIKYKEVESRMFRYAVELVDPEKDLAVAYDWCAWKWQINRTVKKLLKKQFAADNPNLMMEFRAKATMK